MAQPSGVRNFFGKAWDRITPGVKNYDPNTGNFSHTGSGVAQVGARVLGLITGNPLIGTAVSRGIGAYVNRADGAPSAVQPEAVSAYGLAPGYTNAVAMPSTPNLGLGVQSPGNSWAGFLQGQGSANNFGNTQFGTGMASVPGSWSPSSQWGRQITAQPAAPGSNLGFGNNVQGFAGGGGGGGSGGGSSMGGSRMGGIVGGRLASESMLDVRRRW